MSNCIQQEEHDDILVISFAPQQGRAGIDAIRSYFTDDFLRHSAEHQRIVVDLSQVPSLDSSSLGPLVQRHRELMDSGGRLILCGLHAPSLREVFALTRFDHIFTITDTRDQALQAIAQDA